MIAPRHLPKAPIKEALIDIQVVLPENSTLEALNSKYVKITDAYPKHETLQRGQFGWQLNRGKTVQATVDDVGYRYTSSDGKHVVQFRRDGFTFSRLEPYDKWEQMRDEAARLWEHYKRVYSYVDNKGRNPLCKRDENSVKGGTETVPDSSAANTRRTESGVEQLLDAYRNT